MSDLIVETWQTDRLVEYARNPRKNDEHVDRMVGAIREFGFRIPIVAKSDGTVVDGHLRLKAARKMGLATVPVALADGLTDAQIKAFRLLANKSASWAEWDDELLRLELGELGAEGFDVSLIGFSDDELASILADRTEGLTDPDDVPEPPAEPASVLGDVWLLGRHRLACGDCTTQEAVDAALAGVKPHLMVTDPPYGVEYDPSWREDAARKGLIGFSPSALGTVQNDKRINWSEAWMLFPGEVVYCWHADRHASAVQASLEAAAFQIRCQIIWAKSSFAISRGHYNWQHEPCWYAVRQGKTGHWHGDHSQTTLWNIHHGKSETGHSTQKPVECMRRPIENNSSPGQAVYDPFVGSGTTIIAAEMTGRACHAIELSPAYTDVAVLRWQSFTGQTATHASDGRTFADIAAERVPQPVAA